MVSLRLATIAVLIVVIAILSEVAIAAVVTRVSSSVLLCVVIVVVVVGGGRVVVETEAVGRWGRSLFPSRVVIGVVGIIIGVFLFLFCEETGHGGYVLSVSRLDANEKGRDVYAGAYRRVIARV